MRLLKSDVATLPRKLQKIAKLPEIASQVRADVCCARGVLRSAFVWMQVMKLLASVDAKNVDAAQPLCQEYARTVAVRCLVGRGLRSLV